MPKRRRARKSRKHPEPHLSRCDNVSIPPEPAAKQQRIQPAQQIAAPGPVSSPSGLSSIPLPPANTSRSASISPVRLESHPDHHSVHNPPVSPIDCAPANPSTITPATVEAIESDSEPDDQDYVVDGPPDEIFFDFLNHDVFELFTEQVSDGDNTGNFHDSDDDHDTSFTHPGSQCEDNIGLVDAMQVLKYMKTTMRRPTLLGIISLYGKPRFTLECYEHLVALMKDGDSPNILPCATTMRQHVFPKLIANNFVTSTIKNFAQSPAVHMSQNSQTNGVASELQRKQDQAVLVLPSDWAKYDIRSFHVLREIACVNNCRCNISKGSQDIRIESTPSVLNRSEVATRSDVLWVNEDGVPTPAKVGSSISLHFTPDSCNPIDEEYVKLLNENYRGEECRALHATIISTEHVVHSASSKKSLKHGLTPPRLPFHQQKLYINCISLLEDLCRSSSGDDSDSFPQPEGSGDNELHQQTRREKRAIPGRQESQSRLLPGDHLTLMTTPSPDTVVVLVSRFWVNRLSDERNFGLLFNFSNNDECSTHELVTVGAPTLLQQPQSPSPAQPSAHSKDKCLTTGILANGKRFYKYRMLLYADDFSPRSTLFPKGSVGGLYMSPSGFGIRTRRSQSTIRTISLTPHGVSTNTVFDYIIQDLVDGCLKGIECVDAYGIEVVVFLEITGFVGDYPASSAVVDVKGHTASSPCTHCTFPRDVSLGSSMYAYTTLFHSCHTAFRRSQSRSDSVHAFGLCKRVAKNLGMKIYESNDTQTNGKCPLLKLASNFNSTLNTDNTTSPVVQYPIDGYNINIIAPDHLICGLFKSLLTLCFIHLEDETSRTKLTISLRSQLLEYGFQTQTTLFKKSKLVPSLSMSSLYCLLTILPATMQSLSQLETSPVKKMLLHLYRFFSMASWRPCIVNDGEIAWSFVHGNHVTSYHRLLQRIASNFAIAVHKYCKSFPSHAHHIDRPNVHRLIELATHTIPLYNHMSYVCELVYESAHQPLKFFLSRNHCAGSHIYAVHLILSKDWLVRLWSLWQIHRSENETEADKLFALLGIIRLLGGPKADRVRWTSSSMHDIFEQLKTQVYFLLCGTIEGRLKKWYQDYACTKVFEPKWVLQTMTDVDNLQVNQRVFYSSMLNKFASLSIQPVSSFKLYNDAYLQRGYGSKSTSSHERLRLGDVIQLLLPAGFEHNTFLHDRRTEKGSPQFFVVGGLFSDNVGIHWTCIKNCTSKSSVTSTQIPNLSQDPLLKVQFPDFYSPDMNSLHFIRLDGFIRKIGVIHDCSSSHSCVFSKHANRVLHSTTTLQGGHFYLLTRCLGYPPRRS